MRRGLLAALALLLLGCVARLDPGGVLAPEGFRAFPELVALHRAVNRWNEAVPALGLRLVPGGASVHATWTIERYDYDGEKYGHTSRWTPLIRVDAGKLALDYPRAPLEHLTATAMHEIAHALGLRGHLPGDVPDLLRRYHSGATCVDARTLAWLLRERPELAPGARVTCERAAP